MKKFYCLLCLATLAFVANVTAQVNTYSFATSTGQALDPMAGSTLLVGASSDDGASVLTNFSGAAVADFTLNFGGINYTTFSVNANGILRLGAVTNTATTYYQNSLTNMNVIGNCIMPYWDDLHTGVGGKVHYVVTGTAPNRVMKIEWFVTVPRSTSGAAGAKFQCWIYETTNAIQFIYGSGMVLNSANTGYSIGLGKSTTVYNNVVTATNTNSTSTFTTTQTNAIASGTSYTFAPNNCSGTPASATITGSNTLCSGAGTTLSLSTVYATQGITYQWQYSTTPGGPYTNLGIGATQATSNLTATTYYLATITCSFSGQSITTPEKTITVNAMPTVTITPNPANAIICGTGSVTLTAGGASTYTWSPTTNLSPATGSPVTASPAATTTYTVTGTDGNGCTNTASKTVTVSVVTMNSVTATTALVCSGNNSQLNAVATATPGANYTVASITPSAETANGTATVLANAGVATAVVGGRDLDDGYWDNIALPFSFTFYGVSYNTVRIGTNGNVQFGAVVNTLGNPGNSSWTPQTIPTAGGYLDNFIAGPWIDQDLSTTPFGKLQYYVTGVAPNRKFVVSNESVHVFNSTDNNISQIILNENGSIDVLLLGNGLTAATTKAIGIENGTGSLGIAAPGRNTGNWTTGADEAWRFTPPPVSYSWSPSTFLTDATISTPMAQNVTSTTSYTVTATDGASGCSTTGSVTVTLNATPSITGQPQATQTVCKDAAPANLTVTATGNGLTYEWYSNVTNANSGGTSTGLTTAAFTPPTATAGTMYYYVVVSGTCSPATTSNTAEVIVNAMPTVTITPNPANAIICGTGSVTLTAGGASTYTWSPTTNLSPATGSPVTASPAATTTYTVTGTDGNGCTNTASKTVTVSVVTMNSVTATPALVCSGSNSQLNAVATATPGANYTVASITPSAETANGTATVLSDAGVEAAGRGGNSLDDGYWDNITLPFTFTFYGVSYNTVRIGTNGNVQFGVVVATGGLPGSSSWIPQTIPTAGGFLDNFIAGPWIDQDLSTTPFGKLQYYVTGVAPNRKFVVSNESVHVFSSTDNNTSQIILNENGTIDVLLLGSGLTAATNKAIGIENGNGILGIAAPGRNTGTWVTGADEAWRFTPPSLSYSWSPSTFLTDASTSNPIAQNVTSTTSYTVTATDGASGCSTTGSVTVTVNASPSITGQPQATQTICRDATPANLTVTATGNGLTYEWYSNVTNANSGGTSTGLTTAAFTPSTATAGTMYYYVVVSGTCSPATTSNTAQVIVNTAPSITGQPVTTQTVCTDAAPANLTVTATGNGLTFEWYTNTSNSNSGGTTTGVTTAVYTPLTATAGTLYYYVVVTGTCSPVATSNAAEVIVNAASATPIINAGSATTFCNGNSVTLTSSSASGNQWYKDGNAINTATSNTYSATTSGTYTVGVTSNGCSSGASPGTDITVNPIPSTPSISAGGATTFCNGSSVTLSSSSASGNHWYKDGNAINTATSDTYSATTSGTYTVVVTTSGCSSSASPGTDVTVNPIPSTPSISAGGATTLCNGNSVTLTSSSASGNHWYRDGNAINLATSDTYTAGAIGDYTVVVTNSGCSSPASAAMSVTVTPPPSATISYNGSPYCSSAGTAAITRTGTAGGTYSSSAGLSINANTGDITLGTSAVGTYTVTYTVAAAGGCAQFTTTTSVTVVNNVAIFISYAGNPFCKTGIAFVTRTGGVAGGTYSSDAGMSLNATTGYLYIGNSTLGSHTITYSVPFPVGCTSTASTTVTILPLPTITLGAVPTICQNTATAVLPYTATTLSPTTYSIRTDVINPMPNYVPVVNAPLSGGTINVQVPANTPGGTYYFDLTVANANGCVSAGKYVFAVKIASQPSTVISYAGTPFCATGVGFVTRTPAGGTFSSSPGLSIDATSGTIYPAPSTPGTYTVSYTVTLSGCTYTTTTDVTILPIPKVTIGTIAPVCVSANAQTASVPYTVTANTPVSYSITAGATNPMSGYVAVTNAAISNPISVNIPGGTSPGTYSFYLTLKSAGGCVSAKYTFFVTVKAVPTASIAYPNSPYSTAVSGAAVTNSGTTGGTYNSTPGLSLNPTTGSIFPHQSTPGTYTVTYTVTTAANCTAITTTQVTIVSATTPRMVSTSVKGTTTAKATPVISLSDKIVIAPNPVERMLTINTTGIDGTMLLQITNATGSVLVKDTRFSSSFKLDMSSYAAGVYIVEVLNERTGEMVRKKVVKQ